MNITKRSNRKPLVKNATGPDGPRMKASDKTWVDSPESKEWEKMQVLTEHWQADLKFFQDEIRFLDNLISKYFLWLIEEDNIKETRLIATQLSALENKRQKHERAVIQHQKSYHDLIENPFSHDSQKYMKEHASLESAIAAFVTQFKNLKRDTFELTEHVLESEKVKHLISNT